MSVDLNQPIVHVRSSCVICEGTQLEVIMDLPHLPLTGRFTKNATPSSDGINQKLLWCAHCYHAQLAYQVDPQELYNEQYHFRTSRSQTACRGTAFFIKTLEEFSPKAQFECVLDLGCNDLYLLGQLKSKAKHRFGIDPLWRGKEDTVEDKSLSIFGLTIEEANLKQLNIHPDLIVCRHTLEHIYDARAALEKLYDAVSDGGLIVIEVPSLNGLFQRQRFDQVFHQHVHYFSQVSLRILMTSLGAQFLGMREHYHDWGAMCLVFQKSSKPKPSTGTLKESFDATALKKHYRLFQSQVRLAADVLYSLKGKEVYGYGAAQMLPILAYHMGTDLSMLTCVLDDDVRMHQYYYWNLPLRIEDPSQIKDWGNTHVFLSAVDNVQPILKRLFEHRPKHIIYPLNII